MERDQSHQNQVERWAQFCLENPEEWKKIQKEFIDAQFFMAERFYQKLMQTADGRKIFYELKKMRIAKNKRL